MSDEFLFILIQILLALTAGFIIVLCLRKFLRRRFSAIHGYAIWLLVPLLPLTCLITWLMPKATLPILPVYAPVISTNFASTVAKSNDLDITGIFGLIWVVGIFVHLGMQYFRQMQFMHNLGEIRKVNNIYTAQISGISPALVGLFHPKIILPSDFAVRYTSEEQSLILIHEKTHQLRGDNYANAFCAAMLSVFWFHPLAHFCAKRFRFDQELACDELVMKNHKNSRKAYANAMLKTITSHVVLPAACHWHSHQLLKERIMRLNEKTPRAFQRHIGSGILVAVLTFGTCMTWAAQSTPAPTNKIYDVSMTVTANDGTPTTNTLRVTEGKPFILAGAQDKWAGTVKLSTQNENSVRLEMALAHADKNIGHPTVISHFGEMAKIKTEDGNSTFEINIKASPAKSQ